MNEYLDKINKALKDIEYVCDRLDSLERSLYETGNTELSGTIGYISKLLDAANQDIDEAVSKNIQEQFETAQQSTNNMLNACLAMSEVEREKKAAITMSCEY